MVKYFLLKQFYLHIARKIDDPKDTESSALIASLVWQIKKKKRKGAKNDPLPPSGVRVKQVDLY